MSDVMNATNDNFSELVLNAEKPCIVDFWAEWCGPCKTLAPVLEDIAKEVKNQAHIFKVNVDENSQLAQKYGIRGIPTMIFFKDGEIKNTLVGNQPKNEILKSLKELMV